MQIWGNSDLGVKGMNKVYTRSTLEECLELACKELNVPKETLTYTIINQNKSFFKKSCTIEVETIDQTSLIDNNGSIEIKNGIIKVKNPFDSGKAATISPSKDVKLIINDKEIQFDTEVYENSKIKVSFFENEPHRRLNTRVSDDKLEAYININYIPKIVYCLKDSESTNNLVLQAVIKENVFPLAFKKEEILDNLKKMGISYGLIDDNIDKCIHNEDINNLLVAKGIPKVDDEDDYLELKFDMDTDLKKLSEDNKGKVDFKSIGAVTALNKGDTVAIVHSGKAGNDGIDVYGNINKCKNGKKIKISVGQGCVLKDENTVLAAIQGKPCMKNNTFHVYQLHEVSEDVDISTGNIKFLGDILIHGDVKEGMKVESGNAIKIKRNVERAEIVAKGDIAIDGNIISSTVSAGGQDTDRFNLLKALESFRILLSAMVDQIENIKKFNLIGYDKTDGQIVKILIDTKYKNLTKICLTIITQTIIVNKNEGIHEDSLASIIKSKLLGLGPLSIRHYGELFDLIEKVKEKMEGYKKSLIIPVNVKVGYSQDSNITSSGNIMVTGRGVYVSNLEAHQNIYFTYYNSVVRGGCIKASKEIKCKVVGSVGGVVTKLMVEDRGHIWIDTAYENTILSIGNKEHTIDLPSRNIHAYLNSNNELIVDRLKL